MCADQFSVIIPTLQKSHRLRPLVDLYCAHGLVGEVIIINNAAEPLIFEHPKVQVLQQEENIFVNPAWNLGAREAKFPLLVVSNDDIMISPAMIDAAARLLRLPTGIVGPDADAFCRERDSTWRWARPVYQPTAGFGTLMFMRASNYVPIPDELLIWCGDFWLFHQQKRRNVIMKGFRAETDMGTTSGRSEFRAQAHRDGDAYIARYHSERYVRRYLLEWRLVAFAARLRRILIKSMFGWPITPRR